MGCQLAFITNWESLAEASGYCVTSLAQTRGVSARQLERFFQDRFGKSPHVWLRELRLRRALELLKDGTAVKEVAFLLKYKNPPHLSHDFKHFYGIPPSSVVSRPITSA